MIRFKTYRLDSITTYTNILISVFVTAIFAVRWSNCLPFSGKMPLLNDSDLLAIYGRYLIWVKEPFGFPLGAVHNLGFPFDNTNISKASIPLFAIVFKFLSKIYAPFSEFYFSTFFEIIAVFITAYFTCLLLRSFHITSGWIKLLGSILICLSPALLFRSSIYYGMPFCVGYFPVYLAMAYYYIRFYKQPNLQYCLFVAMIFPISALLDYYLFLGVVIIFGVCLGLNSLDYIFSMSQLKRIRLKYHMISVLFGMIITITFLFALDNQSNLQVAPGVSALVGRFETKGAYGGGNGLGGGFHVADVFSVFIPPGGSMDWKRCGPPSYFTKLGLMIKTAGGLQDGQYEGFTYMGTTLFCLLSILGLIQLIKMLRNAKSYINKIAFNLDYKVVLDGELLSLPLIVFVATFVLYIMSWGYIMHIGGYRLDNIPTPYLFITDIYPTLMFARSPGRLAGPFMLYLSLTTIVIFGRYAQQYIIQCGNNAKYFIVMAVIVLSVIHIYEISGYLKQSEAVSGNDIINVFNKSDRIAIKDLLHGYNAVLPVPEFRNNPMWTKICYALTTTSNIPIGGASAATGTATTEQMNRYKKDGDSIQSGDLRDIIQRYGRVAVVTTPDIGEKIVRSSNVALKYNTLDNKNVVILTLDVTQ